MRFGRRALAGGLLLPLLAGCSLTGAWSSPTPPPTVVVDLGGGVRLTVAATDRPWSPTEADECVETTHVLDTASGTVEAALLREGCRTNRRALNGFHGSFAAVPAGVAAEEVATPIGTAQVFTNEYTECTNSCTKGTDQVAVIAVGTRTLQVIAVAPLGWGDHVADRAGLVTLLQGLRAA